MPNTKILRLAAVGDVHCSVRSHDILLDLFGLASSAADALLLCGDLTDHGSVEEAEIFARQVKGCRIPVVGVLGNHDWESGKAEDVRRILTAAGLVLLDGDTFELFGVGFAGVKGYLGGFGSRMLQAWGEPCTKSVVHESIEEALKFERALAGLRTAQKVALLHYAPIVDTVIGEACEIQPFLGSGRLEDSINRHAAVFAVHGHAHMGSAEGKTSSGIPVYNVALPLLRRLHPDGPPFRLIDINVPR